MAKGSVPVLVGVGQMVSHWQSDDGVETAPSFLSLGVQAARRALEDAGAGGIPEAIDTVAMVRTMDDSIPSFAQPFGRCNNLLRCRLTTWDEWPNNLECKFDRYTAFHETRDT